MTRARPPTSGTQIAALEARRNEQLVRAEGALLGERRASLARLAMVAMFGTVTRLSGIQVSSMRAVGIAYALFALTSAIVLHRLADPGPKRSFVIPLVLTVVDFTFTTTLGLLDPTTGGLRLAQHVVALAIVLGFSLARVTVFHVAFAWLCAETSLLVVSASAGALTSYSTLFMAGGLAVLGLLLALTNRAIGRMFHDLRRRDNLTRFLPQQVAERVLAAGSSALIPVEREVTVLFSDIRGFTSLSESLEPREVLLMLDDYFGRMSQIVKGHDGVVGKFIGDGLLAFWGVPDRAPDHARRAVRAAGDMRAAVAELNAQREADGKPALKIGIGIHTGLVAAGMLGGALQAEYTVIGDAVNVASRVEGLTKEHGVDVLVSETTWSQLGDAVRGRRVAAAEIRGRKEPVVVYALDA